MGRELTRWFVSRFGANARQPARAIVTAYGREWRRDGLVTRMYYVSERATVILPEAGVSDEALVAELLRRSAYQWNTNHFGQVRRALNQPLASASHPVQAPSAAYRFSSDVSQDDLQMLPDDERVVYPTSPIQLTAVTPYEPVHFAWWETAIILSGTVLGLSVALIVGAIEDISGTNAAWTSVAGPLFMMLAIAGTLYACFRDWDGVRTLRGTVKWYSLHGKVKVWAVIGFIYFYIFLVYVYDVQILVDTIQTMRKAKLDAPLERQRRISHLEADLGLVPATEGTCKHCHEPLQVNATFCSSCGKPTVERPRVCPACAATALPNARFCPKCGKAIPAE